MSAITFRVTEPEPAPSRIWEISYDGNCPQFHPDSLRAATAVVNILTRRQMKGWAQRPLTIRLLDEADTVVWDASTNAAEVIAVTGWPGAGSDRDITISLLEAVLVSDLDDGEEPAEDQD